MRSRSNQLILCMSGTFRGFRGDGTSQFPSNDVDQRGPVGGAGGQGFVAGGCRLVVLAGWPRFRGDQACAYPTFSLKSRQRRIHSAVENFSKADLVQSLYHLVAVGLSVGKRWSGPVGLGLCTQRGHRPARRGSAGRAPRPSIARPLRVLAGLPPARYLASR